MAGSHKCDLIFPFSLSFGVLGMEMALECEERGCWHEMCRVVFAEAWTTNLPTKSFIQMTNHN